MGTRMVRVFSLPVHLFRGNGDPCRFFVDMPNSVRMTNDPAERELNKSQKFIRILEAVARRGGVSTSELMSRFDLDARTLRRYLADLRDCGLPLQDRVVEGNRVLSVDASWARSAVQLSLAEVLSLHFGRTLFTFLDGTSFAADMTDAIERLAPVIGREDAERTRDAPVRESSHVDAGRGLSSGVAPCPSPCAREAVASSRTSTRTRDSP